MNRYSALMLATLWMAVPAYAGDMMHGPMMGHGMAHPMMPGMAMNHPDDRTSLNLPAPMRAMQKRMMRDHLAAVNEIVGLIAEDRFDKASRIAHARLGLTPEMKRMCDRFENADFRAMGLAFHRRADELGEVLKTRNTKRSLAALHRVMNSCVQCHATFRQ